MMAMLGLVAGRCVLKADSLDTAQIFHFKNFYVRPGFRFIKDKMPIPNTWVEGQSECTQEDYKDVEIGIFDTDDGNGDPNSCMGLNCQEPSADVDWKIWVSKSADGFYYYYVKWVKVVYGVYDF